MLAKTNGQMLSDIFGRALDREAHDVGHVDDGPPDLPPVPVVERPRKPPRPGIVRNRIVDSKTGKPIMVELSAAAGYAITKVTILDFDHKTRRYQCAVEVMKSRGRPRKAADDGEAS